MTAGRNGQTPDEEARVPRRRPSAFHIVLSRFAPLGLILAATVALPATVAAGSETETSGRPAADTIPGEDRMGPTDAGEIEAFLDGLMSAHRSELGIAGATVAIVRDGELLFSKGYGWADVAGRRPVDPATTLFRIGSVTKTFTWTAVMQLEEEGLLDLDADVNEYLDFRIPDTFDQPITLRHLLTHTPGFEDRAYALFRPRPATSRGEWLHRTLPGRMRPPGTYASYSNYGAGLAGYIVERVSGMEWERYLEARILEPLGMEHATGREPVPDALAPLLSWGFVHQDGAFQPRPFESAAGPAGGMSASAEAMAHYMIAHLEGGALEGRRILQEANIGRMQERAFAADPRINAMTLGFYEKSSHGLRIVGHSGGTQWFFTDMALVPDEGLGVFVSYNSPGAARLPLGGFLTAFLDHYYPVQRPPAARPAPGWEERARAYPGSYRLLRVSHTTFERPFGAVFARVSVELGASPGEIVVRSPLGVDLLREVEPGYFSSAEGHAEVAFEGNPDAGFSHLFLGDMPSTAAARIGFWDRGDVTLGLLAFALLLFLSHPVVMLARWLLTRRCHEVEPSRGLERSLRWLGVVFLGVVGLFIVLLSGGVASQEALVTGEGERMLRAALLSSLLLPPILAGLVAGAVVAVRRSLWGPVERTRFLLFVLAAAVFVAQLHHWNLLGPRM